MVTPPCRLVSHPPSLVRGNAHGQTVRAFRTSKASRSCGSSETFVRCSGSSVLLTFSLSLRPQTSASCSLTGLLSSQSWTQTHDEAEKNKQISRTWTLGSVVCFVKQLLEPDGDSVRGGGTDGRN